MCYRTLAECCLSTLFFSAYWPAHLSNSWFSICFVLARQHTNRSQPVLQCKVLQKVLLQFSMRPARICLASVLCSHALLPPQRRITRRRSTGSLKAYNELAPRPRRRALETRHARACAALAATALASVKALPRESLYTLGRPLYYCSRSRWRLIDANQKE